MVDLHSVTVGASMMSALAVGGLGLYLLGGGTLRPRGGLPLGLFALLWGLQALLGSGASLAPAEHAAKLYLLSLGALLPLVYLLTEFSADLSPEHEARVWRVLRGVTAAVALLGAALLVVRPTLLFAGVGYAGGEPYPIWGPWHVPVVAVPFFTGFGIALVALTRATVRAPTVRTREQLTTLLAGLGVFASYLASNNLAYYGVEALAHPSGQTLGFGAIFLALSLICLLIGLIAYRDAQEERSTRETRAARWTALAFLVPLAWGPIEGLLTATLFPDLYSVGLWRLLAVGVLTYGVVRMRDFHLWQRVKAGASRVTGVITAVAGGGAAFVLTSLFSLGSGLSLLGAGTFTAISLAPSLRLARKLFGLDEERNPIRYEEALYEQRIDSYRAALEASMARSTLEEDEPFLASLRERYGISDEEDRVLRYYARQAVVVTRDGDVSDTYERLRILGEGGAGRTWLARDRSRDRLVVLKEPLPRWQREPTLRQMFLEEARLAARVRHPSVVRIEEVIETDRGPVLVMEHVEGGSLSDLLRAKGTLPWDEAISLVHDILSGLHAVHERGIIHRDIKPSNILLSEDGRAKIGDFGIATRARRSSGTAIEGQESPGQPGTRAYMAPELLEENASPGPATDVYACGALLHECLYGTPPGAENGVVVEADAPAWVQEVLARALAHDPAHRFRSAEAFAQAITRRTRQ